MSHGVTRVTRHCNLGQPTPPAGPPPWVAVAGDTDPEKPLPATFLESKSHADA